MTFTSYAQNFEDVMLWRTLKHVKNGFYVDVGAERPERDSVTKAFYDMGWCGINIEPNPIHFASLKEHRTRDTNLPLAVGDSEGSVILNCVEDTGLSTLDDAIADQHRQSGWQITQQQVVLTTLQTIWQQHVPPGQDVHFLKVDVEGHEEAVLRGNDWNTNRPWVVVVEATFPNSQQEIYMAWEPILLRADYAFAYADGLNRFYVAKEHSNLLPAFKYPPNVFDQFFLIDQKLAEARAQQAEAKVAESEVRVRQAETKGAESEARAQHAENALHEVSMQLESFFASKSWRGTAPLRWAATQFGLLHELISLKSLGASAKKYMSNYIETVVNILLKSRTIGRFTKYAGLQKRFWTNTNSLDQLSPRSRQIYSDLKAAIAAKDAGEI